MIYVKLKSKIILFTVLICIISILSISTINYVVSIKRLEKEVNEKVQIETMNIAKDIDKWMALQKNSLREVIEGMLVANNFEYDYGCNYLKNASERNPGNLYFMSFSDQYYLEPTCFKPTYDPTQRGWYVGAIKSDDFYISSPYVDTKTQDMVITISKAFKTIDGREGVIATDIRINYLVELISSTDVGEGSYAFLIDNWGNIVTHLNDDFKPSEDESVSIENILDGKLNTIIEGENLALKNKKIRDYDGVDRFFFFGDVLESKWKGCVYRYIGNCMCRKIW